MVQTRVLTVDAHTPEAATDEVNSALAEIQQTADVIGVETSATSGMLVVTVVYNKYEDPGSCKYAGIVNPGVFT